MTRICHPADCQHAQVAREVKNRRTIKNQSHHEDCRCIGDLYLLGIPAVISRINMLWPS
jgi:hypothetical protein